jgi:hypothetical protein
MDSNENRDIKSHVTAALSFSKLKDIAKFVKPEKDRFVSRL